MMNYTETKVMTTYSVVATQTPCMVELTTTSYGVEPEGMTCLGTPVTTN